MDIGRLGRCLNFLRTDSTGVVSISDILGDAAAKQHRLLRYDPHSGTKPFDVQCAHAVAIHILCR